MKNLQRMESGKQNLSLATVERVCRALDVPVESIFAGLPPAEKEPRPPRIVERLGAAGFSVRAATDRGRRPTHAVPVMTLRAAAGRLDGAARAIDVIGWVALGRPAEEGQFVAEVHGESMDPKIPNEALCLFGRPGPPPLRGHILLVAHESIADDELGGPFALKRLKSTRKLADGRTHVVLESTNKTFPPLVLDVSEGELRIVAELVRVLVP